MKTSLSKVITLLIIICIFSFLSFTTLSPTNSGATFVVRCIGDNKIRISAHGDFADVFPPPGYRYHISLIDLFRDNIPVSIHRLSSSGTLINAGYIQFHTNQALTQSDGGSQFSYGVVFPTAGVPSPSIVPNEEINGYVDLHLTYPSALRIEEVLQPCNSSNSVMWGLPGSSPVQIGHWTISCDCPCE